MKRLLIAAISPLRSDPRVLRQIELFQDKYQVITMGYGPRPDGVAKHVRLPEPTKTSFAQKARKAILSALRWNEQVYLEFPGIRAAKDWLAAGREDFDAALVNDLSPVPALLDAGKPVHVDLHEWALGQHPTLSWRFYQLPVLRWAAGRLGGVTSATAVSPGIAGLYAKFLDGQPEVVASGPRYQQDRVPRPVGRPIRLVHMGVAHEHRSLDMYIEAVQAVNERIPGALTLDMYLVPMKTDYMERLKQSASNVKDGAVRILPPVPFQQMIDTLAQHDVALVFFPPKTANLKFALPNKFFEAVQARIGVITGPSQEMAPYIQEFGFGEVVPGWTLEDLSSTLSALTPEKVAGWKEAADTAAEELGAEKQDRVWERLVARLMEEEETDA